jgi:hypothetical protein
MPSTRAKLKRSRAKCDALAMDHPPLDELLYLIEPLLRAGINLQTAYAIAVLLRPTTDRKANLP